MWTQIWSARIPLLSVVLFAIGFCTLLLHRNLIKKIIGLNIMDTALYLLLVSLGYIEGGLSPILTADATAETVYVNPLPAGLVLTGIVVSVSVTALMLALTLRLYKRYHSLNVDEIYRIAMEEHARSKHPHKEESK